jgi:hypothetical protein
MGRNRHRCGAPRPQRSRRGRFALTLRAMHGMLSAGILMGAFAAVAGACLYVVGRVHLAGKRRGDGS